jgi:hypothetical protein
VVARLEAGQVRIVTLDEAIRRFQQLLRRDIPDGRSLAGELIAERRVEASVTKCVLAASAPLSLLFVLLPRPLVGTRQRLAGAPPPGTWRWLAAEATGGLRFLAFPNPVLLARFVTPTAPTCRTVSR